jgi:mono/diheme cytochrome c family protein
MIARAVIAVLALFVLGIGGLAALSWRAEIAPINGLPAFDPALVLHGAELAAIGDCAICHTLPDGKPFAGGVAIPTPFGTIYSTNITPERETGIGRWSEAAFRRAMNEGVDRRGRPLYPAFPYDHFTLVGDQDNKALYAFLMTRIPVSARARADRLIFPLNLRFMVAGWKLLFFRNERFQPDPAASDEINRGAYLADGLGHCGACHTPRNAFGAERRTKTWSGGAAEGWTAYALDRSAPAPTSWDKTALAFYLAHGWHERHGAAYGPMASVTAELGLAPESDVAAIAAYVASRMAPHAPASAAASDRPGNSLYDSSCAGCHESGRALPYGGLDPALSTAVAAPDPQNLIDIVLYGLPAPDGKAGPIMPGFAGAFDDGQIADLLSYMRRRFATGPAWPDLERRVRATRTGEHAVTVYRSDGVPAPRGNR